MDLFLAVLAILSIALFFVMRFRLNAAAAPLFAASATTLWIISGAMLGLLPLACWTVYISAAASLCYVFAVKRYPLREIAGRFFCPGVAFFVSSVLALSLILAAKQASFRYWDEFSFWGTAAKVVFQQDALYTLTGASIAKSYLPALPLFSYFAQFFSGVFTEWKVYAAYNVLSMAAMAALFSRLKWKNCIAVLSLTAFALLGGYAFFDSSEGLRMYANAYADMQLGLVFGGALLTRFAPGARGWMRYLSTLLPLLMLVFMKDMGLAVALICGAAAAADMLISGEYPVERIIRKSGRFARAADRSLKLIVFGGGLLLLIACCYLLWNQHFAAAVGESRDPRIYEYSFLEMLAGKDAYFNAVAAEMTARIFGGQLIAFGSTAFMCAVFLLLPCAAAALAKNRRDAVRTAVFSLMLFFGFLLYYYFHAYTYAAVFWHYDPGGEGWLISYNRYISSYCIGWMVSAAGVLFAGPAESRFRRGTFALPAAAAALLVASTFYFLPHNPDQYLLTSKKIDLKAAGARAQIARHLSQYQSAFSEEDRVYFLASESDSGEWFIANYEVQPAFMLGELGAVSAEPADLAAWKEEHPGEAEPPAVSKEEFARHLLENEADFLFVYRMSGRLAEEIAPLFFDEERNVSMLDYVFDDSCRLFRTVPEGDSVRLVPVFGPEGVAAARGAN